MLHGALAYLECRLKSTQEAGDHTIFIAEVEDVVVREGEPLLFFRGKYRKIGDEAAGMNSARKGPAPLERDAGPEGLADVSPYLTPDSG